ncbi:branched-chain amino acid ABC transporter permease [Kitasatospora sp. NPDC004272]
MNTFVETLFNGLTLGSVYALVTVGFVVVFKASGAMNFAHGSLLLLGGYLVAVLRADLGFAGALAAAAACTAAAAGLLALVLRAAGPDAPAHTLTILTIGADLILSTELARRLGPDILGLADPWGDRVVDLGPFPVAAARLASLAVSVVLVGAVLAAFRWSRWGLAMRAATQDREAAALMGVRQQRVRLLAWCVAGVLATVAAVFLASFPAPGLDRATGTVALKALPAAILGGIDSVGGALLGSMLVGVTEALVAGYHQHLGTAGQGLAGVAPYAVMVLVLLVRPRGLLGSKETSRV